MTPATPLFVYGTLMLPEVLRALLGRVPAHREALLAGYRRYAIVDECYPAIVSDIDSSVGGLVLEALSAAEHETLDAYEGDAYVRTPVTLTVDGMPTRAACYVWRKDGAMRLSQDAWDVQRFRKEHLEHYLRGLG